MPMAELSPGLVMVLIVLIALPLGALAFALGAGNALRQIGKGDFAIEQEKPSRQAPVSGAVREEEVRQMVTAQSYRRESRGEQPLDVDAEVERLLAGTSGSLGRDQELREEVRQLVVARNERRQRQGKEPLDVEAEIERELRELEDLGQ